MKLLCGIEESLDAGFEKMNDYYLKLMNNLPIPK
ncbi:MAG: hypothetical protein K940chlam2_00677 [Chlamydiae bacterium]|nr:hypothetical protein [Chlamydiota bacterium]